MPIEAEIVVREMYHMLATLGFVALCLFVVGAGLNALFNRW